MLWGRREDTGKHYCGRWQIGNRMVEAWLMVEPEKLTDTIEKALGDEYRVVPGLTVWTQPCDDSEDRGE